MNVNTSTEPSNKWADQFATAAASLASIAERLPKIRVVETESRIDPADELLVEEANHAIGRRFRAPDGATWRVENAFPVWANQMGNGTGFGLRLSIQKIEATTDENGTEHIKVLADQFADARQFLASHERLATNSWEAVLDRHEVAKAEPAT